MTPAELRRAAEWLECGHWIDPHTAASPWRDDEIPELVRKLREEAASTVRAIVLEQAEDEGLWFDAQTAPEAYLQHALRTLHAAVELEPILPPQGRGEPTKPRRPVETCPACGGTGWAD
jgi:crotonobetainyl-CoA:carnitine CoA-transferase CaiB-like acyl-CoA transferase